MGKDFTLCWYTKQWLTDWLTDWLRWTEKEASGGKNDSAQVMPTVKSLYQEHKQSPIDSPHRKFRKPLI
jgi:hypothetical protein